MGGHLHRKPPIVMEGGSPGLPDQERGVGYVIGRRRPVQQGHCAPSCALCLYGNIEPAYQIINMIIINAIIITMTLSHSVDESKRRNFGLVGP
jgi:hypothetical protein